MTLNAACSIRRNTWGNKQISQIDSRLQRSSRKARTIRLFLKIFSIEADIKGDIYS